MSLLFVNKRNLQREVQVESDVLVNNYNIFLISTEFSIETNWKIKTLFDCDAVFIISCLNRYSSHSKVLFWLVDDKNPVARKFLVTLLFVCAKATVK